MFISIYKGIQGNKVFCRLASKYVSVCLNVQIGVFEGRFLWELVPTTVNAKLWSGIRETLIQRKTEKI